MDSCLLCTDVIEYHAIGPCDHSGVCGKCAFRLRHVDHKHHCPICKQDQPHVIVSSILQPYMAFDLWEDIASSEFHIDIASDMYFHACLSYFNTLRSHVSFTCPLCKIDCLSKKTLLKHVQEKHYVQYCTFCLDSLSFFISEQKLYSKKAYGKHTKSKRNESTVELHPACHFCSRRFIGETELYNHLERDHFKCHLCNHEQFQYRYFKKYRDLELHFRKEHHLCEEKEW